jgi:hypothetical protein
MKLQDEWERLPPDAYADMIRTKRFRRYSKLNYSQHAGLTTDIVTDPTFYQSAEINSVYGGIDRRFPQIQQSTIQSPTFLRIFKVVVEALPSHLRKSFDSSRSNPDRQALKASAHQIRCTCDKATAVSPAPEGIHRDGHQFLSITLICRENVNGGISRIYDNKGRLVFEQKLTSPLDTIVINDLTMMHSISEITCGNDANEGKRDILIFDFDLSP